MKQIRWEVELLSPPETLHYCKKCSDNTQFLSSGLFRVNAQQKTLDVWLVYRCAYCKTTWNLPIYSRVNTKSLPPDLLKRFQDNDAGLARQYAMDTALLKQNGAEIKLPRMQIIGDTVDSSEDTEISIHCKYPLKLRVSKVLRQKLELSQKAFDQMVDSGRLRLESGADIRRWRLQPNTIVLAAALLEEKPK